MIAPDYYAQIVASSASPALAVDAAGRVLAWNSGAEQLFGHPATKVLGRTCWDAIQGLDLYENLYCGPHCPLVEMARRRQPIHGCDLLLRNADGKRVHARVNLFIVPGGAPNEMVIVHLVHPIPCEPTSETPHPGSESAKANNPLLTERQLQVLRLIARGATTREICRELRISAGTARHHCGKILQSLQAHTRLQAVATARALHLIG